MDGDGQHVGPEATLVGQDRDEVLRTLLDAVPAAIWYKDTQNRIVTVNSRAAQLEGLSAAELRGRSCWELYPPDQAEAYWADDSEVIDTGESKLGIVEEHSAVASGEVMVLEVSKVPVRSPTGQVVGVVAMAVDITERRRLEEALRTTQRLEGLSVLAGGLAHEFNNLLAAVFGFTERARVSPDCGPLASEHLSRAGDALGRARTLTRELLTFSRGGSPVRQDVDLAELLRAAQRFSLCGSSVAAHLDIPDDLWLARGDSGQLLQLFDNLLINARQAMGDRGDVSIVAANVSPGDGPPALSPELPLVRVSVRDRGPGIAHEDRTRIFDPFFTTKNEGSGLGLAVVWSVSKRHDGHVEVLAPDDGGAEFVVWIPAVREPAQVARAEQAPTAAPAELGGRALVMDDEPLLRELLATMLKELGFSVDEAADGSEALKRIAAARLEGEPYDVALVDLTIRGGTGGEEVAQHTPDVPLIAVSGYAECDAMAAPESRGFAACLSKPFLMDELERVVSSVVGRPSKE